MKKSSFEFETNEAGNLCLTFESPIGIDNGYTNTYQGEFKSLMELHLKVDSETGKLSNNRNGWGSIEWTVENTNLYTTIGVWWEHGKLVEYDGVFELPKEVKKLLNNFGVTVPKHFFD